LNKNYGIFIIFLLIIVTYFFILREPKIIYVHEDKDSTVIIVRNFPITQWGKIYWWENNKDYIKEKYNLSKSDINGNYNVVIFNENGGFKRNTGSDYYWFSFEHVDFYCFDEINSEERCIERSNLMMIQNGRDNKTYYYIDGDSITK
jgi:hypothetical protein